MIDELLKREGLVLPEGKKLRLGHSKTPMRDALACWRAWPASAAKCAAHARTDTLIWHEMSRNGNKSRPRTYGYPQMKEAWPRPPWRIHSPVVRCRPALS